MTGGNDPTPAIRPAWRQVARPHAAYEPGSILARQVRPFFWIAMHSAGRTRHSRSCRQSGRIRQGCRPRASRCRPPRLCCRVCGHEPKAWRPCQPSHRRATRSRRMSPPAGTSRPPSASRADSARRPSSGRHAPGPAHRPGRRATPDGELLPAGREEPGIAAEDHPVIVDRPLTRRRVGQRLVAQAVVGPDRRSEHADGVSLTVRITSASSSTAMVRPSRTDTSAAVRPIKARLSSIVSPVR